MHREYDIVVAGGGPSGLQFAREVAGQTDLSVAVLEANDSLSDNDKSTGGTFQQVVERYDVPDEVIMGSNRNVMFEGPTERANLPIPGYVLDFPAFLEFLGGDAERRGADVQTGVHVEAPVVEDGQVTGVHVRDGGERRDVRARLVVDATGPASVLTGQLGLFDRSTAQRGIGKEFEVRGRYDLDAMLFRFDHAAAPGGYAWTFPAGNGVFKAGVCWIDDFFATRGAEAEAVVDDYVRAWLESDPRWEAETVQAVHAGEVVSNNSINRRAVDGLLAVGDAVSSINPLFGEGIRPGMESASMAAEVAIPAVHSGDVSRERLAAYERRWNAEKGRYWRVQRLVGELLYDFDADQQDRFVRNADALDPAQADRLQQYELTLRDLLGLYPFKFRDVPKLPTLLRHFRG